LTPNESEAAEALGWRVGDDAEAEAAARELRARCGAGAVLLTRGNRGMVLVEDRVHAFPIHGTTEIVDPTGAGDTVVAAATLARAAGGSYLDAARLANLAASVKVMKSGAAVVSPSELLEAASRG
ncbi:MAG: PfkB family carbohydrate kinase, partial [Planctomycetota bacterium]